MTSINSVEKLLAIVRKFSSRVGHHAHLRLWFRGQADATWKLTAEIFRDNVGTTESPKRLNLEQRLSQDFRIQAAGPPDVFALPFLNPQPNTSVILNPAAA